MQPTTRRTGSNFSCSCVDGATRREVPISIYPLLNSSWPSPGTLTFCDSDQKFPPEINPVIVGAAAGLAHAYMQPASKLPLIGASGAVAGVIGAYLLLHPRVLVWVLAFRFIPLRIPAALVLGVWVATQILMVVITQREADTVAWWAHIGGFAAGIVLVVFMRRPGVPLLDKSLRMVT